MRGCVGWILESGLAQQSNRGVVIEVVRKLEGLSPEWSGIADAGGMCGRADADDEQRQDGRGTRPTLDHEVYDIAPISVQSGTEPDYSASAVPTPAADARV
jgi:hypothetical protein